VVGKRDDGDYVVGAVNSLAVELIGEGAMGYKNLILPEKKKE